MPTTDDVMVLTRNVRGGGRPCGQRNIIVEDWMERGRGGGGGRNPKGSVPAQQPNN